MDREKMTISQTDRQTDRQRYVGVKQATKTGYIKCVIGGCADLLYPSSTLRRGRVQGGGMISPTIATTMGVFRIMDKEELGKTIDEAKVEDYLVNGFGIFKLSDRECLRLMDVTDDDIDKIEKVVSPTQRYKQAGNSIVVSVLCGIFSQLHIQGIKAWNERSEEEKRELIATPINR